MGEDRGDGRARESFLGLRLKRLGSRKLLSDASWSLVGTVSTVLTGFVSIKVITALVPSEVYGEVSLVLGVLTLLTSLLSGPLVTAHGRLYFDYVERGLEAWYWRVILRILAGVAGSMCLLYVLWSVAGALAGNSTYLHLLVPACITLAVLPCYSVMTSYFEAKRCQRRLALTNVLNRVLNVAAIVVLLYLLPADFAIVAAQGIAGLLLLAGFSLGRKGGGGQAEAGPQEIRPLLGAMLRLGWMLGLGWAVQWVLTTSDRYLVNHYMTERDVGIYAVNYTLWATPYIVLNGWLETLTRPVLYARAAKGDGPRVRAVILKRTALGLVLSVAGTLLLWVCGGFIGEVMLGPEYWAGKELMIVLAAGHCFFVLAYSLTALFLALKRTGVLLLASGIAAAVNVSLNAAIIPRYGLVGAGWGTLLAYLVWAIALMVAAAPLLLGRPPGEPALVEGQVGVSEPPAGLKEE